MKEIRAERGIGLMGISKGGDIALSMAAFFPENKIGATFIMNSYMNSVITDATYKGVKVLNGRNTFHSGKIAYTLSKPSQASQLTLLKS